MSRLVVRFLGFDIFEVSTDPEETEVEEEEAEKVRGFLQPGGMGGVESVAVEVTDPQSIGFGSRRTEPVPGFDPWED